jgi:thioredoxin 1
MIGKFKNVINSRRPVLVDFYADWCIPCKEMQPILKQVKNEFKEQIRIVKVNVDRNPNIATFYQIKSIPTLMLFENGVEIWRELGVPSVNDIKSFVNKSCIV